MGGSSNTSSSVKVPAWISSAAQDMLKQAQGNAQVGYTPYYGADVAAMTPAQIAAMTGTNSAASAFGLPTVDVTAGMPAATDYNGMSAYSSGSGYDAALAELKARFPAQFEAIMSQFIDPVTGMIAGVVGGQTSGQSQMTARSPQQSFMDRISNGEGPTAPYTRNAYGSSTLGSTLSGLASNAGSYLPGGVNSRGGILSNIAGSVRNAISPQGAPTAADRPVAKPASMTVSRPAVTVKPAASKPVVSAPRSTYF